MSYFVTGATGFVGGRVARQLVAQGHQVIALVRDPAKAQDLANLGITLAPGDITDKESLRSPMTNTDGVFHIAGWYKIGVKNNQPGAQINIQGTRNVLETMQELGIPKGVYTSTLAVNSDTHGQLVDETYRYNGPHLSEYDRTKAVAHAIAEEKMAQGLPLVVVMPGLIYGPGDTSSVRQTFVQYLKRQLSIIPAQSTYCWAHVDDIANAHLLAMEKGTPGETYIIAGPSYGLTEAFALAQKITSIPKPWGAPPILFKGLSQLVGLVETVLPIPDLYSSENLRVLAGVTYLGNNTKAKQALGYDPRSLEVGLAETLNHEMALLGMDPAT
ncbi:MAG: NAD-dependent epimerase/dehydratase family protein [Thermosynechococcaceae cyanobacterium]